MNLKRGNNININSKGQVTIFIIIGIFIIGLAVLIYFLFPKIKTAISPDTESPSQYIDTCMREKIEETIELVSLQGGSYEPNKEYSYFYPGDDGIGYYIEYLCYTNQYYQTCVVQQPLLIEHIKSEINNEIHDYVDLCFASLIESYEKNGYESVLKNSLTSTKVELLPERIVVYFDNQLTLKKGETETYDNFQILINSNLYQMATISLSIIEWEEEYGNAPTSTYMNWYHNLKIEKHLQSDGTNIYILNDRDYGGKFQFASRSVVFPPGYLG